MSRSFLFSLSFFLSLSLSLSLSVCVCVCVSLHFVLPLSAQLFDPYKVLEDPEQGLDIHFSLHTLTSDGLSLEPVTLSVHWFPAKHSDCTCFVIDMEQYTAESERTQRAKQQRQHARVQNNNNNNNNNNTAEANEKLAEIPAGFRPAYRPQTTDLLSPRLKPLIFNAEMSHADAMIAAAKPVSGRRSHAARTAHVNRELPPEEKSAEQLAIELAEQEAERVKKQWAEAFQKAEQAKKTIKQHHRRASSMMENFDIKTISVTVTPDDLMPLVETEEEKVRPRHHH